VQMAFGARVRSLRESADLTEREVANAIGISLSKFCALEAGRENVRLWDIYRLARALGCQPSGLMP